MTMPKLARCIIATLALSACAPVQQTGTPAAQAQPATPQTAPTATTAPEYSQPTPSPMRAKQQILEFGTGEFLATPDPSHTETSPEGDLRLNFEDTDLREFVKVVLSDLLGVNYLMDPRVTGRVSMDAVRALHQDELFPLLEEVLAMNNAAIIKRDDMYHVVARETAARSTAAPSYERRRTDGYSVRVIPLRYISAQEMQKILDPFVADGGNLRIDTKRNLLIVSGTGNEIQQIQDTIDIFDVDWLRGMSVGLYPLDYVDPENLKSELDVVVASLEGGEDGGSLNTLVRTVAIERLNSILLISPTQAALREVEIWLHRLDRPGEHPGRRLYVYDVQNVKAVELADILSKIVGTTTDGPAVQLAPGLTPVEIRSVPDRAAATGGDVGMSLPFGGAIDIIADDTRNALVILAAPQDYKMVAAALEKLDVVPLQVLIEASILEVTLRDDLNYGVEWFFKNNFGAKTGRSALDTGSSGIAALAPSFSYTIIDNADQVRVALNALSTESEVNVLSSPTLMVLDNQTATINVGDEIPVPSRQSVSNLDPTAPTVNEIQFRKTGVTLSVTPRVNKGGLVTMEIKQEVSTAVDTTTSDIDAPTIQNRLIESVVAINSGETVVLGGLIQDTDTEAESGVPGLRRIPLIGRLFSERNEETLRTELVVLITPRVVGGRDDAKKVTDEFRTKLRGLRPTS